MNTLAVKLLVLVLRDPSHRLTGHLERELLVLLALLLRPEAARLFLLCQ